jgi:competence protein ComEC
VSASGRALGLAAAAAIGALTPHRASLLPAVLVAALWVLVRRPLLAGLAVALLASTLAQRSLDGLHGVVASAIAGPVVLVSDPAPHFGGIRVDVRWGSHRLVAEARGASGDALRDRLAGDVVSIRGTVRPVEGDQPWLVARHVAGELTVHRVDGWRPGDPLGRLANGLRRTLVAGAAPLDARERSLYTGLVIGDDRAQPDDLADAFRGAGLTHLLAVSGQNVAFALALAGPVLRRLRLWPRLLTALAVIALFGVVTRFEPSVLRASAMAALAAVLAMPGHPVPRVRILGLAVTGLVLVDPLLVRSAGFQLSTSAALAIVIAAPRLSAVLPGPRPLREAAGVTVAAQVGVAPVLLTTFGPIPVASLPANLLCVPVAGLVMAWGLTAGLVAGVTGSPLAAVLHAPTHVALGWLDLVATRSAEAPLGELHGLLLVAVAAGLGLLAIARGAARRAGGAVVVLAVVAAVLAAHAPPPLRTPLEPGVVRWHAGGTDVVVLGGAGPRTSVHGAHVLEGLRRAGVRTIDLLVVAGADVPDDVVALVRTAHPTGVTHRLHDGSTSLAVGRLEVRIVAVPGRLVVDAVPRAP